VDEFPARPLNLLADTRLRGVETDHLPGEPEHLALTKAQGQDEDVSATLENEAIARSACRAGLI
jgi:hypothetical protein